MKKSMYQQFRDEWNRHLEQALDRETILGSAFVEFDGGEMEVESARWAIEERRWVGWSLAEGLAVGEEANPRREFSAILKESLTEPYSNPCYVRFTFCSVKRKLFVDVELEHVLTIDRSFVWAGSPNDYTYLVEGVDVYVRGGKWEFVPGEFTWGKWWAAFKVVLQKGKNVV